MRHSIGAVAGAIVSTLLLSACGASSTGTDSTSSTSSTGVLNLVEPVGQQIGCSTATAGAPRLSGVGTHFAFNLLTPFGVAFSSDGSRAFVAVLTNQGVRQPSFGSGHADGAIDEFDVNPTGLVSERLGIVGSQEPLGLSLTPNGRYLVAAEGSGARVLSIARIEDTKDPPSKWAIGTFSSHGQGAIETAVSADGRFVFVSLEDSNELAVFNLGRAERRGFGRSDLVGYVPMGRAPVGMAISANGRDLFATSEAHSPTSTEGTLTTIDLRQAEKDPSRSVVSTVWAGCNPVRVVASSSSVFVTARASDDLLEFAVSGLVSNPSAALQSRAQVGEAPVGLALVNSGQLVVVADSNRFAQGGVSSNLAVVSVHPNGGLQSIGYLPTGGFPRDMVVSPNGKELLVSGYDSGSVEEVNLGTLP
jgi:DNA-binding beta-propeller fold protein YncE